MEETETVLTLADFGALLRERRIHKGLTEENVAAELKITSRLVKAIEEGDMESMPACRICPGIYPGVCETSCRRR